MKEQKNTESRAIKKNCNKHGLYIQTEYFTYGIWVSFTGCPICKKEINDRLAENKRLREEREKQQRIANILWQSNIPKMFANYTIAGYEPVNEYAKNAIKTCQQYKNTFNQHSKSLVIAGSVGVGKTHLACALAIEIAKKYAESILFIKEVDMIARIRDSYKGSGEEEMQIVNSYVSASLLVIDDIGTGDITKHKQECLYRIIDGRYSNDKPIIITTNLDGVKFKEYIGDRAYDRLKDKGGEFIVIQGKSYRG